MPVMLLDLSEITMRLQIFDNVNLAHVTFLKLIFYLGLLDFLELKVRGKFLKMSHLNFLSF